MIQSSGYLSDATIVWQLEDQQLDFSSAEFADLIAHLKEGGLFAYLDQHRPALRASLLEIFEAELLEEIWDEADLEHHLENALRTLALKLEHGPGR